MSKKFDFFKFLHIFSIAMKQM